MRAARSERAGGVEAPPFRAHKMEEATMQSIIEHGERKWGDKFDPSRLQRSPETSLGAWVVA